MLRPAPVPEAPQMAVALSEGGRMLLFPAEELREIARGRGIMLMGLDKGEKGRTGSNPATNNDLF